jgi:hypothetical protein
MSRAVGRRSIGILREAYSKWERRAPLTPRHVARLVEDGVEVLVQPSTKRVFTDREYESVGAVRRFPPLLGFPRAARDGITCPRCNLVSCVRRVALRSNRRARQRAGRRRAPTAAFRARRRAAASRALAHLDRPFIFCAPRPPRGTRTRQEIYNNNPQQPNDDNSGSRTTSRRRARSSE